MLKQNDNSSTLDLVVFCFPTDVDVLDLEEALCLGIDIHSISRSSGKSRCPADPPTVTLSTLSLLLALLLSLFPPFLCFLL